MTNYSRNDYVFGGIRVADLFSFLFCVFYFICLRSVSGVQCCLCLWIVHSGLPLRFSQTFIYVTMIYIEYYLSIHIICNAWQSYWSLSCKLPNLVRQENTEGYNELTSEPLGHEKVYRV